MSSTSSAIGTDIRDPSSSARWDGGGGMPRCCPAPVKEVGSPYEELDKDDTGRLAMLFGRLLMVMM
jgi:hypothetical protein